MNTENNQRTLGYLFKFSILVEKVVINIGVPCKLSVIIKRDPVSKCCYFDEIIDLKTNVYWDADNEIFWDKKVSFTLVIESQNGNKLAGIANYNLATFLNSKTRTAYEVLKLNKCPDQNAKLYLKFDQSLIKDLGEIDSESSRNSLISDSIDDFHDITFQSSSNRSILQDKSQLSIDSNHINQPSVKYESNFGASNQNNLQIQQVQMQQQNHARRFSSEIQKPIAEKQIDSAKVNILKSSEKRTPNDENIQTVLQKNNQNTQQAPCLNDSQKLFILESHMKTMISEKEQLKQEILLLKQTLSIKNDNLQNKTEECNEYFQRYEDIKNQRDDIKSKLDEVKKETEKIECQVFGKIELMREDFCKQLHTKEQENQSLIAQNLTLNQKVKELISDNKTCSERILKNEQTMKELQESLDRANFQSTKINHSTNANIVQMSQEIENLQSLLKQSKENIQRLEYNKKRKDEEISKFIAEIHDLKQTNSYLLQQNNSLVEQIQQKCTQEEQQINEADQDQFMSFLDKPSQILQQNNQSMNMKSFMSNTQNEFHSCIVQDFDEDFQKNNDSYIPPQNASFKRSIQEIKYPSSILQEVKEENSFEKQMNTYKNSRDEYSLSRKQKQSTNSFEQSSSQFYEFDQSKSQSQITQIEQSEKSRRDGSKIGQTKEDDIKDIIQKYQNIEKEYKDGKDKWEKIDKDNSTLKHQMTILNQKFEKMESQLEESKRGLSDALALALKAGDQELVSKLQKTIRQ